jgi:hypothetical protein
MSTPTISSSVLFNLNNEQLTFADNTNYSSFGIALSNVNGNLRVTGPSGIFYNNTSWVTPSITLNSGNTVVVNLPTNVAGDVLTGNYDFLYTIRVGYSFSIVSRGGTSVFNISGDQSSVFTANTTFTITGGPNAGTYSVASSSYDVDTGLTTININETTIDPDSIQGTISISADYTDSFTRYYSCDLPTVNIEATVECDCGEIESTDLTNYGITVDGTYIYPTIARTHIVYPPISPSTGQRVTGTTTSSSATIILSPIWTGDYISTISSVLTYDYGNNFTVIVTVAGSESYTVECTSELCCVYSCLANIFETWKDYKNTNLVKAEQWKNTLTQAYGAWMLYSIAKTCGQTDGAETYLAEIINIAKSAGCTCCTGNSAEPTQVVPICGNVSTSNGSGTGGNVVITTCGNGITVQATTVGITTTYQLCIDTDILNGLISDYLDANPISLADLSDVDLTGYGSGSFLRYDGQDWVPVNSISIDQITEINVTSPLNGQVLVYNSSTGKWENQSNTGNVVAIEQNTYTSSGSAVQTLKSVTIPAGTLTQVGDYLDIDCEYLLTASSTAKRVLVGMSSNDSFTTAWLNASAIRRTIVSIRFIRTSPTTVRQQYRYDMYGNYGAGFAYPPYGMPVVYSDPANYTVNNLDVSSNTVQFRYDPSASSTSGSLVNYTIKLFKL